MVIASVSIRGLIETVGAVESLENMSTTTWIADAIRVQIKPGTIVLSVHGCLPPTTEKGAHELMQGRLESLPIDQKWDAVIDLQNAQAVPSSVLGIMVMVRNFVRTVNGKVAVCNVSDPVREKMQRLNLIGLWLIVISLEEARIAIEPAG